MLLFEVAKALATDAVKAAGEAEEFSIAESPAMQKRIQRAVADKCFALVKGDYVDSDGDDDYDCVEEKK